MWYRCIVRTPTRDPQSIFRSSLDRAAQRISLRGRDFIGITVMHVSDLCIASPWRVTGDCFEIFYANLPNALERFYEPHTRAQLLSAQFEKWRRLVLELTFHVQYLKDVSRKSNVSKYRKLWIGILFRCSLHQQNLTLEN